MFAESKTLRMGIRYDIGNNVGWGGMLNFQSNPFEEITKGIIEARAAQQKDLITILSVGNFTVTSQLSCAVVPSAALAFAVFVHTLPELKTARRVVSYVTR